MTFGLFESSIGSEQEVGMARQASADKFNTAVYDVREKLGSFLFQAESLEDFRDRVAMTKNDQSLFKIIEASGLHPATGIVRRIAGKNSVLEEEFKQRLATTRRAEITDDKGGFTGPQDIDSTFSKEEQGKELKPKDDWKGYLNSVDQDAPGKVKRNFASKQAWNVYLAWCVSNGKSAARLSSLDAYATNLSDAQYLKLANSIQACNDTDWGSDHHPKTPNTKLKKTDKVSGLHHPDVQDRVHSGMDRATANDTAEWDYPGGSPNLQTPGASQYYHRDEVSGGGKHEALRRYVAWCDRNGYSKVAKSTIDHYVSRVAGSGPFSSFTGKPVNERHNPKSRDYDPSGYMNPNKNHKPGDFYKGPKGEDMFDGEDQGPWMDRVNETFPGPDEIKKLQASRLRKHLYAQVATTIRWARTQRTSGRRTAAPDYLQKADDALTQLLNQKAQEFQETIAPLQQALQTVQQAEQLQQQANPLNVLPPAGTVNVMPGGGQPSTADQVGMPDPNQPDMAGLAQLLSGGGGTAPNDAPMGGGQGAPPPAAAGGGLPPDMDPTQQAQQMAASRKRRRQARGVGEQFDAWKNRKTQQGDLLRGGEPDYEQFAQENEVGDRALEKLKKRNQTPDFAPINRPELQGVTVGSRKRRAYQDPGPEFDDPPGTDDFHTYNDHANEYKHPGQDQGWSHKYDREQSGPYTGEHYSKGSAQVHGGPGPDGDKYHLHTPHGKSGPYEHPEHAMKAAEPYLSQEKEIRGGQGVLAGRRAPKKARGATRPQHRGMRKGAPFAGYEHQAVDPEWDKGNVEYNDPAFGARVKSMQPTTQDQANWSHPEYPNYQHWMRTLPAEQLYGGGHMPFEDWQQKRPPDGTRKDPRPWPPKQALRKQARPGDEDWLEELQDRADGGDSHAGAQLEHHYEKPHGFFGGDHSQCPECGNWNPDKKPDPSDPRIRGAKHKTAWSGWGPAQFPKARKVAGWDWDDHLNGYLSDAPRIFTCGCGHEHQTPNGYQRCKCGKAYNSYVIGTGGSNREASADKFLVREIPVRENVIVGSRKRLAYGSKPCMHCGKPKTHHDGRGSDIAAVGKERFAGGGPCPDGSGKRYQFTSQSQKEPEPAGDQAWGNYLGRKRANYEDMPDENPAIGGRPADADWHLDRGNTSAAWALHKEKQHGKPLSEFTDDDWAIAGDPPKRKARRRTACYPGCEKNEKHVQKYHKKKANVWERNKATNKEHDLYNQGTHPKWDLGPSHPETGQWFGPEDVKNPDDWDQTPGNWTKKRGAVQLVDPRTGTVHRLIDPGELTDGEDAGHPTMKKPPRDWAHRGDGAKWVGNQIG